jgi:hypothetical protein
MYLMTGHMVSLGRAADCFGCSVGGSDILNSMIKSPATIV